VCRALVHQWSSTDWISLAQRLGKSQVATRHPSEEGYLPVESAFRLSVVRLNTRRCSVSALQGRPCLLSQSPRAFARLLVATWLGIRASHVSGSSPWCTRAAARHPGPRCFSALLGAMGQKQKNPQRASRRVEGSLPLWPHLSGGREKLDFQRLLGRWPEASLMPPSLSTSACLKRPPRSDVRRTRFPALIAAATAGNRPPTSEIQW
jgi:hypothetical protein